MLRHRLHRWRWWVGSTVVPSGLWGWHGVGAITFHFVGPLVLFLQDALGPRAVQPLEKVTFSFAASQEHAAWIFLGAAGFQGEGFVAPAQMGRELTYAALTEDQSGMPLTADAVQVRDEFFLGSEENTRLTAAFDVGPTFFGHVVLQTDLMEGASGSVGHLNFFFVGRQLRQELFETVGSLLGFSGPNILQRGGRWWWWWWRGWVWLRAYFLSFVVVADGGFDRAGSFLRALRDQVLVVITDGSILIGRGIDGQLVTRNEVLATFHVALLTSFFAL